MDTLAPKFGIIEDTTNGLSIVLRGLLNQLGDDLKFLNMTIKSIDFEIKSLCKLHPRYKAYFAMCPLAP